MILESLWAIASFLWKEEVGIKEENRGVNICDLVLHLPALSGGGEEC